MRRSGELREQGPGGACLGILPPLSWEWVGLGLGMSFHLGQTWQVLLEGSPAWPAAGFSVISDSWTCRHAEVGGEGWERGGWGVALSPADASNHLFPPFFYSLVFREILRSAQYTCPRWESSGLVRTSGSGWWGCSESFKAGMGWASGSWLWRTHPGFRCQVQRKISASCISPTSWPLSPGHTHNQALPVPGLSL